MGETLALMAALGLVMGVLGLAVAVEVWLWWVERKYPPVPYDEIGQD